eukprot:6473655-Amphidinium_carterae.2
MVHTATQDTRSTYVEALCHSQVPGHRKLDRCAFVCSTLQQPGVVQGQRTSKANVGAQAVN